MEANSGNPVNERMELRRSTILTMLENGLFESIYLLSETAFSDITICLLEVTTDPLSMTSQTSTHTYSQPFHLRAFLAGVAFFWMEVEFGEQMGFGH